MATAIDEEELRRILDEGSASSAPMQERTDDLAALRAQLATEAQRQQAETAVEPQVSAPAPSRTPIAPKVVDLTKQSPDDLEMAYAQELDRKGRQKEAFERGTREIIAGITRTPVAGIIGQPKDAVAMLLQKRARNDAVQQRNEQNRLGGAKLNFDQQEAARKAALEATQRDEGKAKDERDFNYRQEHDAQADATSRRNADVTAGFRGREEARTVAAEGPKNAAELRKEFNALPDVKSFGEVDGSFRKIQSAAVNDSPAGDLALITGYMKIIDPGSSVKEGEFLNAQNAGGIPDKLVAQYNNLVNGERLSPAQRADFVKQAKVLYDVHRSRYDAQAKRYGGLASKAKLDPGDVVGAPSSDQVPSAAPSMVQVRRKSDGMVKAVPRETATVMLANPDFEEVK